MITIKEIEIFKGWKWWQVTIFFVIIFTAIIFAFNGETKLLETLAEKLLKYLK